MILRATPTVWQLPLAFLVFSKILKIMYPTVWQLPLAFLSTWHSPVVSAHICALAVRLPFASRAIFSPCALLPRLLPPRALPAPPSFSPVKPQGGVDRSYLAAGTSRDTAPDFDARFQKDTRPSIATPSSSTRLPRVEVLHDPSTMYLQVEIEAPQSAAAAAGGSHSSSIPSPKSLGSELSSSSSLHSSLWWLLSLRTQGDQGALHRSPCEQQAKLVASHVGAAPRPAACSGAPLVGGAALPAWWAPLPGRAARGRSLTANAANSMLLCVCK
jgi:hypothetical protein